MAQRASVEAIRSTPNRIPPHNLDAEQSVLGAMLESREAIANVVEVLDPDDFYKPAHGQMYRIILELYGRGEPADAITVADELARRGQLEALGGKPYILGLLEAYPTASSAVRYGRIVEEHALLRRLIEAGTTVQELGFSLPEDVGEAVDEAERVIYEVGDRRLRVDLQPIRPLLAENMEAIERLYEAGDNITGTPSGFHDLDEITLGFQPGTFVIVAARPSMGKSSLLGDFALHSATRHQQPVVIFSLEMSRHEIVQRFLASEAKVDSQKLRRGSLQEQDWSRLAAVLGRLAEAPLFIDDSASISLMEMRAKCRRLKARHGLGLIIVDYLQLMQSPRRSENRQQEVSEISRGLKILAKELDVPVLCASQLNRGVEARADKRPLLGDLRESGCLTADTRIARADTGASVTLGQLLAGGERDIPVWTTTEDLRLIKGRMTHVFPSGTKEVFRLRLRSGLEVKASANHQFLSFDGWKRLDEIAIGERLGVPRRLPPFPAVGIPRKIRRPGGVAVAEPELQVLVDTDVMWREVVAIEPLGPQPVFDATVTGTHNFVAGGMIVHNSIEQDSDMVMFIYRDEVYNPDSDARGEAELIVAKHRNGPTGTVRLAFMNQYTKFASIARGIR